MDNAFSFDRAGYIDLMVASSDKYSIVIYKLSEVFKMFIKTSLFSGKNLSLPENSL